ncbi:MAG: hypothetical protein ABNH21_08925 [Glaciecola sp.]
MSNYVLQGAGELVLGQEVSIGKNVTFIIPEGSTLTIGDYVTIGDSVRIVISGGNVDIGDWSTLHSNVLVLSGLGVSIGQHCWFGQNAVLDGTGELTIRNGVRVGMYSQIWSHVAAGEQIEGCTLFGTNPVNIEEDVWLVGTCTVGSGVTIGRKAICMNGSNVTKNVEANTVVAGLPAKLRPGLSFYKELHIDEKFKMLVGWLEEFEAQNKNAELKKINSESVKLVDGEQVVWFFKAEKDYNNYETSKTESKFVVETKIYSKTMIMLEKNIMKFLSGNKARFYN